MGHCLVTDGRKLYVSTVADQGFSDSGNYNSLIAQAVNFSAGQSTASVSITIDDLGLTSGSESYRAVVLQNSTDPASARYSRLREMAKRKTSASR